MKFTHWSFDRRPASTTATFAVVFFLLALCLFLPASALAGESKNRSNEGTYTTCEIEAGPFNLFKRYKSMEGPWLEYWFRMKSLMDTNKVVLDPSMVRYTENEVTGQGPSMSGPSSPSQTAAAAKVDPNAPRELYWFKGVKVEVIDEHGKVMPDAEFICHLNLDVITDFRNKTFPQAEPCNVFRVVSLTQGQTDIRFPDGFGVPVASDERWAVMFQAANRTTDKRRILKQRCTLYFVKDSDLVRPMHALAWYIPAGVVVVEKSATAVPEGQAPSCCLPTSEGVQAPNRNAPGAHVDQLGRKVTGHWVVPQGKSVFHRAVAESVGPGFSAEARKIHFVWTHIHPCCTTASLIDCSTTNRDSIFDIKAKTRTKNGLQILHIDTISTKEGFVLPAKHQYEISATYDNTTDGPLDSMVSFGIFYEDNKFTRPSWCTAAAKSDVPFCGVPVTLAASGSNETAQPSRETNEGSTPLMTAIRSGDEALAKQRVLNDKAYVNTANIRQETALHIASIKSSPELVQLLLKAGADINPVDEWGQTPLFIAVHNKNNAVAMLLISKGADINKANNDGTTPLIMSTFLNDNDVSLALIKAGAKIEPVNKIGDSAPSLAQKNNNQTILTAINSRKNK